jgi:hypothetical protein
MGDLAVVLLLLLLGAWCFGALIVDEIREAGDQRARH